MNELYEKNMKLLRERLPLPAAEIDRAHPSVERRAITAMNGTITYQCLHDDGVWRSLTSAYNPVREAEAQVNGEEVSASKIVFIVGEGGLYHVEQVLKHADEKAKVMLMSLRPDILKVIFETRDLTEILSDDRLVVVATTDIELIKAAIRGAISSDLYDIPTFSLVIHPIERRLQEDTVYAFYEALHWLYTVAVTTANTMQYFEHWWSHNFVRNIPYVLTETKVIHLKGTWADKPVVIVGAGPSLNKNIKLLHGIKGKALIMCVDTAYRILQKEGLEPDFLITLDGSPMNAKHMENCNYQHLPMFADEYSHYEITTNHTGPKIMNSSGMFHAHWWRDIFDDEWTGSSVATGGSVATTAFSLARLMDANPVIMLGVDLSYPEGKLYADGALRAGESIQSIETKRRFYEVEDIFGNKVVTTHDYLLYLKWLEGEAQRADRTYINATEGGALSKGFTIMSLAECIEQYCRAEQPIEQWKSELISSETFAYKIPVVLKNMKRSRRELKAATRFLDGLVELATTYAKRLESGELASTSELTEAMSRIQKRLITLPFAMKFLDAHSFEAVYNDIKLSDIAESEKENHTQREQSMIKATRILAFFTQLHQIAESSLEMHDDGIAALKKHDLSGGALIESVECV